MRICKKGFTLIELLVVIAIIAILAAILFPVFTEAKKKAKQSVCLSNSKQLGSAVTMYVQDNGLYPGSTRWPGTIQADGTDWVYWPSLVRRYTRSVNVFYCPDYPVFHWGADIGSSYGIMGQLKAKSESQVLGLRYRSSGTVMFLEGTYPVFDGASFFATYTKSGGRIYDGHNGGTNVTFADGHSKWMRVNKIMRYQVVEKESARDLYAWSKDAPLIGQ